MYDEAIPNKHLGPSSSTVAAGTSLGIGGVSTLSPLQQPLQHQQLETVIPPVSDSLSLLPNMTCSVTTSSLSSSNATSQLQARLSQPTLLQQQSLQQQPQPQLRYLLERGSNDPPSLPPPVGAVTAPSGVASSSTGGGGGLVTTITSQTGVQNQQQQMSNTVLTTPPTMSPLSSAQGVTTSHRVWVPGTTTSNFCNTHTVVKSYSAM